MNIFEFGDHYSYLREKLSATASARGQKKKFALALRIQPAFLSQILARKYGLSLEQADLASQFFDHSAEEADFFLLLVNRDRAGSSSLRRRFDGQINAVLKKRQQIVERLGKKAEIDEETKGIYYSSWLYSAVHLSCTIPRLRSRRAIAEELGMPADLVAKVLEFLLAHQMVIKEDDSYLPTQSWIRLDRQSPHIIKHHANWRQKAIQDLEVQTDEDLHYSGIFSIDEKTAGKVKDRLLDFWKVQLKEFEAAKEEKIYAVGMDLYHLGKKGG